MKQLNMYLEDEEHAFLSSKKKSDQSWRYFFLELVGYSKEVEEKSL